VIMFHLLLRFSGAIAPTPSQSTSLQLYTKNSQLPGRCEINAVKKLPPLIYTRHASTLNN